MSNIFVKGSQGRVNDPGDSRHTAKKQGRRFSRYSEQEFLESYLGKDFMRRPDLSKDEFNRTFGFQEGLKELFPDQNEFLKMPKLHEGQRKLKEFMGTFMQDGQALDPKMANFMKTVDIDKFMSQFEQDAAHPTEEGRTAMGDFNKMIGELQEKMEKKGTNTWFSKDMYKIMDTLDETYGVPLELKEDVTGVKHKAYYEARAAELEALAEQYEAKADEADALLDDEKMIEGVKERLISELSPHDTE